jgi:hypothetical protein
MLDCFKACIAELCALIQPLKIAFGEGKKKKLLSLGMHQDTQSKAKFPACVLVYIFFF